MSAAAVAAAAAVIAIGLLVAVLAAAGLAALAARGPAAYLEHLSRTDAPKQRPRPPGRPRDGRPLDAYERAKLRSLEYAWRINIPEPDTGRRT